MKKWYLMSSDAGSAIPGKACHSFALDEKTDLFYEALQTDLAVSALLFSHDLSESANIRCIILGNTPDSIKKSLKRTALFFPGTVKAGMYLFYEENYWLISSCPGSNGIYEKTVITLCQYPLRWQNPAGEIIERWCSVLRTFTHEPEEIQISSGPLILPSGMLSLLIPGDKETLLLDGKRVFIDKQQLETETVYKLTKADNVLYDYGDRHGSILAFTACRTEFNPATDNRQLKICDYLSPAAPATTEPAADDTGQKAIISGRPDLKIGYPRIYTLQFSNKENEKFRTRDVLWNLIPSFSDSIRRTVIGTSIELFIEDPALIGETFLLQALAGGVVKGERSITISDVY